MSKIRRHFGRTFLLVLFLAAPTFAQFEIAPDHPPDPNQPANRSDSMQPANVNRQIAQQEALLAECHAQVTAKAEQMEAARQSLMRTGNEAGEAEALAIYQTDLEKLQTSLTTALHAAEATLARLQNELALQARAQVHHPVKPSVVIASARSGA
jgi:flagellar biosynthesis/type III secretory pathway protein FliH